MIDETRIYVETVQASEMYLSIPRDAGKHDSGENEKVNLRNKFGVIRRLILVFIFCPEMEPDSHAFDDAIHPLNQMIRHFTKTYV